MILVLFILLGTSSFSQTKKLTPQSIQEFVELIENNAMPINEHLANSKEFSSFVKAMKLTNTFQSLGTIDEYTVFAPTNKAFQQFPIEVVTELFRPDNVEKLNSIISYHIVKGKLSMSNIIESIAKNGGKETRIKTLSGLDLVAYYHDSTLFIKDDNGYSIKVIEVNGIVSNGLIYRIDTVILPQVDNNFEKSER